MSLKRLQGWWLHHFPGQPVPLLNNPFGKEMFPNVPWKPPLAQLEAVSSRPVACYLGEETDPLLATASFQLERARRFPLSPLSSGLKDPSPLSRSSSDLCSRAFPSFGALLWTRSSTSVSFLLVRGPKLNTGFQVRPHPGTTTSLVLLATLFPDTSQDAVGHLGYLGTLLAHVQPVVNQGSQVLFYQAAFQPLFPKPVALHGVAVTQVQDLALGLVEPHTAGLGPSIQPVQIPLQGLPTLRQMDTPAQPAVGCHSSEAKDEAAPQRKTNRSQS
ncbi:LOW QUALITY PROTEIN: hypothetical protein QYF61_021066 [Mycteria americana]|uniref:Uncharacterized protein n=1 Tax=Mycteria americana TaxID=33587 RepID=A0AAN7S4Y5_MYCAM|nr:LOW QUALITY PROTEIN: hypothetical protein QYF61_021066 [Mycteria americana]